jgi:hypothetical protein
VSLEEHAVDYPIFQPWNQTADNSLLNIFFFLSLTILVAIKLLFKFGGKKKELVKVAVTKAD